MLISRKSLNTRSFHRKVSGWDNVKYYVPLCMRPRIPVTIEMLNKVEPLDTDKPIIKEHKNKLHLELSKWLGYDILQDSPHLYNGLILRSGIYSINMWYLIPHDLFLLEIVIPVFLMVYALFSFITIDESDLHKRYMNLTK